MYKKAMTTAELLKKAEKPNEDVMKLHLFYQGKIEIALKAPVRNLDDFAIRKLSFKSILLSRSIHT